MSKKAQVLLGVVQRGGKIVRNGETRFDGKDYEYRTIWNCDEDADAFVNAFPCELSKWDRGFVGKFLTLYFSIKGGK